MPELKWLGDEDAKRAARRVPYRLLQPVSTFGDPAADNLLIQGDNLQALKALLPFYEHYDDNLEHSQWLSTMYPRLELLRDLLSEDGSIWLTIDDNEAHCLKVLLDEVFWATQFCCQRRLAEKSSACLLTCPASGAAIRRSLT